MFDTVLIANRGEIAVRVISTLRRLGVRSVAVFSDEDENARHVREADVALWVGATPAHDSYLNIEHVLDAAAAGGAQAIHPGYGFLSENAQFVRACESANIVFIGPSAESVEMMGDKIRAKAAVAAAGVPVVAGRARAAMADDELARAAEEVGYPVLVKPSAGGGGKGMRLVHAPDELAAALVSARRESAASFGDDTLFVERYLESPRHVEVQILADNFGRAIHLGERECSLQRRHQKVVEEAPSPLLSSDARARIATAALRVGEVARYRGVGTVEFIASSTRPDEFFFMEMNTRLQVEHPVTEMVTGIDLVEQQLRVAAGEPLMIAQEDVVVRGHAVEARVYAEDPSHDFLPTGGELLVLREPRGPGVRVDSSLSPGARVGTTYDPLLAKVVAHGRDRAEALARLDHALGDLVTLGVATNADFVRRLIGREDVRSGALDTALIQRAIEAGAGTEESDRVSLLERAAGIAVAQLLTLDGHSAGGSRFDVPDGWRVGEHASTTFSLTTARGAHLDIAVAGTWREASVSVAGDLAGTPVKCLEWRDVGGGAVELVLATMGRVRRMLVASEGPLTWVWRDGTTSLWRAVATSRDDAASHVHDGDVRTPMPGIVIDVAVALGQEVSPGDPLVVVEAMKMEYTLSAPHAGSVAHVVAPGDRVVLDQVVARVTPAEEPPGAPTTGAP